MRRMPAAVVLTALVFYIATLAPGLLWGDSAKFQRMAWQGELRFDQTGHPLWVLLAHPLTKIPGLDPALACNLLSAILSALALWPAFRIMRRLGASERACAIACLALAVSHTFWFHAVITEVYALNSLVSLVVLDAVSGAMERDPGRPAANAPCFIVGLLFGAASGNHLLVLMWLPGLAWMAAAALRSGALRRAGAALAGAGFLAGLVPLLVLRAGISRGESLAALAARLARQALLPDNPFKDLLLFALCLIYQFPVPLMLAAAGAGCFRLWRVRRTHAIGLLLLYAAVAGFAFSYQVKDRFAFYLPSYLIVAIFAACGLDAILPRLLGSRAALLWILLISVAAPPALYRVAARVADPLLARIGTVARALPGRDPVLYHLYPGKSGYGGARRFGEESFALLPPRAVVLADDTIGEPLLYLQVVEGRRPDLEILNMSPRWQLQAALENHRVGREVFLAAKDAYYDVEGISTRFDIVPEGPLYHLIAR